MGGGALTFATALIGEAEGRLTCTSGFKAGPASRKLVSLLLWVAFSIVIRVGRDSVARACAHRTVTARLFVTRLLFCDCLVQDGTFRIFATKCRFPCLSSVVSVGEARGALRSCGGRRTRGVVQTQVCSAATIARWISTAGAGCRSTWLQFSSCSSGRPAAYMRETPINVLLRR